MIRSRDLDPYSNQEMICIGGVLDGKRAKCYGPVLEAPRLLPLADAGFDPHAPVMAVPIEARDIYRREQLSFGQGNVIKFWRLDTLSPMDAVTRVFENYKPR